LSPQEQLSLRHTIDWNEFTATPPRIAGEQTVKVSVSELLPYMNWRFFFHTWKFNARFAEIAKIHACDGCRAEWLLSFNGEERNKASEALSLFRDAEKTLQELMGNETEIEAIFHILPARAQQDSILFDTAKGTVAWKFERQRRANDMGTCLSLVDFVAPDSDYVGAFAVSEGSAYEALIDHARHTGDDFRTMLLQTLADRLVEAGAEWLHEKIRKEFWGYAPNEQLTIDEMYKCRYQGIRPAVGYPSIPEQKSTHILHELIDLSKIGIRLTENGAMAPAASVSGLYFMHPESKYFIID
ncbi:MAG: vitamin B12 dependent-methionine synthase activation domain-containing protein, partial [Bacteroidales bacterium]